MADEEARVLSVREDGEYLTVEFTNAAGERVSGYYNRMGWRQAPSAVLREDHERQRNARGPVTTLANRKAFRRSRS